jgi:F-type H+-transporting ATPase subunit delta
VALPAISRAFRELADEHAGQVRATITSAAPLDPMAVDRLRQALESRTGKRVLVETSVDPDLIGGVVARVGDLVLDGSVRARLGELRAKLLN